MSEYKRSCNCNWRAGVGPNLLCPVHGNKHHMAARIAELEADLKSLHKLSKQFVDDVMPQIGGLCIQDFGALNDLCMLISKLEKQ